MACFQDCCCWFTVRQTDVRMVESLGKFDHVAQPGCHFYNCCTEQALEPFSMKYKFMTCGVNSMTKDKVHVHVEVCVHYRVRTVKGSEGGFFPVGSQMQRGEPPASSAGAGSYGATGVSVPAAAQGRGRDPERQRLLGADAITSPEALQEDFIKKAFYALSDAHRQLESWTESLVRGQVPEYTIDGVYASRDAIAEVLQRELEAQVSPFGYTIHTVLVTNIMPSPDTKQSMNEVNRQRRLREAMKYSAEAEAKARILHAEGEAEAQRQSGIGLAAQRKAVVQGLQESIQGFQGSVPDVDAKEVMMLLLMNQYFDTLRDISQNTVSNSVFTPDGGTGTTARMRDGSLMAAAAAAPDAHEHGRQRAASGMHRGR
eukprot:TRINITY_DN55717_c0_g1_i1.p2 TRINITY_DN55717_c0_g1~~TRINITY_DN55717_c0_g1_i1.p2  ORF type:complete len:397 (+),score=118.40 TRINITY_DN55717_c0_g1_i1:76-1191(+)